ncbi:phosphotransferase enzyme family protein [Penicillium freii]|nr:phosphotransferase enzyme family protein [Penicillium freii]
MFANDPSSMKTIFGMVINKTLRAAWNANQRLKSTAFLHCRPANTRFVSHLWSDKGHRPSHYPELCVERPNGAEEKASEEELFQYTRHRWLFNEKNELSNRYVKFNLQELVKVAVNACDGAQSCALSSLTTLYLAKINR